MSYHVIQTVHGGIPDAPSLYDEATIPEVNIEHIIIGYVRSGYLVGTHSLCKVFDDYLESKDAFEDKGTDREVRHWIVDAEERW